MLVSLKVVPEDSPNAEGEWIDVNVAASKRVGLATGRFRTAAFFLGPHVPDGKVLVAYKLHRRAE